LWKTKGGRPGRLDYPIYVSVSIHDLQKAAIQFRDDRDWKQFHKIKDLVLGLGIEVGELGELVLWKQEAETVSQLKDPAFLQRVKEELADIQIFLLYLAESTDVDLAEAVKDKLILNAEKYPVDKSFGSAAKYTDL
jgi:NTP pyrophosphatase (non-canonical NTP hydrolase)